MDLLRRTKWTCVSLFAAAVAAVAPLALESAGLPNEYALKAVFLYNFCRFINWPDSAFTSLDDPIVIGVLGQDPFGPLLEQAVAGESFHGRNIRLEYYRSPREIAHCHLLFVSNSEAAHFNEILASVAGRSIVTVGETEGFVERGGMIALLADRNRVRLIINPDTLRAAHLEVSSKLLRVAEIVR